MRSSFVIPVALCFALSGCFYKKSNAPLVHTNQVQRVTESQIFPQGPYRLNTGDRIRIVVFGQDALSNAYQVDSIGNISMPLIGTTPVAGKNTKEVEALIITKLKDGYVREPHVAIEVETYRPFFIMGEVTQSGQYPFVYGMTAQTAIAISGGFTPRANKKTVEITRRIGGQMMRAEVPLTHVIQPGDIVSVNERWF